MGIFMQAGLWQRLLSAMLHSRSCRAYAIVVSVIYVRIDSSFVQAGVEKGMDICR